MDAELTELYEIAVRETELRRQKDVSTLLQMITDGVRQHYSSEKERIKSLIERIHNDPNRNAWGEHYDWAEIFPMYSSIPFDRETHDLAFCIANNKGFACGRTLHDIVTTHVRHVFGNTVTVALQPRRGRFTFTLNDFPEPRNMMSKCACLQAAKKSLHGAINDETAVAVREGMWGSGRLRKDEEGVAAIAASYLSLTLEE